MDTLSELFENTLQDVYFAENSLVKALPKMAAKVHSQDLKKVIADHLEETKNHVVRLEKVFDIAGAKVKSKECKAIKGLIGEAEEVMSEASGGALDAGALGCAQAVEHYEIARYGALKSWAEELGLDEAAVLLGETLEEEKKADETLSDLALSELNAAATVREKTKSARR